MIQRIRRSFVDTNPTSDYILSAHLAGQWSELGDCYASGNSAKTAIRGLPGCPISAVSTNLTGGRCPAPHGQLWLWFAAPRLPFPAFCPLSSPTGSVYVMAPRSTSTRRCHAGGARWDDHRVDAGPTGRSRRYRVDGNAAGVGPEEVAAAAAVKHQHHADSVASGHGQQRGEPDRQRELADWVLKPPTDSINMLDWKSFEPASTWGTGRLRSLGEARPLARVIAKFQLCRDGVSATARGLLHLLSQIRR